MTHGEPTDPIPSVPSIAEIRNIYHAQTHEINENEVAKHDGVLERGDKKTLYDGGAPLAGIEEGFKPHGEVLDSILLVGNTALGIMRTHGENGVTESVRIAVLPIGEGAGDATYNQSSSTIAKIDTDALRKPRDDGVIQPWEKIQIRREALRQRVGVQDDTISALHLEATVRADGHVDIEDMSTNGTTVVSATDLMKSEGAGGFPDSMKRKIFEFIKPLEEKPHLWQEAFADQRVIDPQG